MTAAVHVVEQRIPEHSLHHWDRRRYVVSCGGAGATITVACDKRGGLVVVLDELDSDLDARLSVYLGDRLVYEATDTAATMPTGPVALQRDMPLFGGLDDSGRPVPPA